MTMGGWEVVVEMVERLWEVEHPTVCKTIIWAEKKLEEVSEIEGKYKLPQNSRAGKPTPPPTQNEDEMRQREIVDFVDTEDGQTKSKTELQTSPVVATNSPGLEAAILNLAIVAETSLQPSDVRHALLIAASMYGDLRGLCAHTRGSTSGRLP